MGGRMPSSDVKRWTPRRKAQILNAVSRGEITVEAACDRYRITRDEFVEWERLGREFGPQGLRVTQIQNYRKRYDP